MIDKIAEYICLKGYMKVPTNDQRVKVVFRIIPKGIYFLCLIDDTERGITESSLVKSILDQTKERLSTQFEKYAGSCEGLAVIFTNDPAETRKRICEGTPFWMIQNTTGKLMIYEDQPGEFYDAKPLLEEMLSKNRLGIELMLAQLKQLGSPVNISLIIINILVFILCEIAGSTENVSFMHKAGAVSVYDIVVNHEYYRLLACTFLHFGFQHLAYNMLALLYMGRPVERVLGKWKYLLLYLLSGIGSSALSIFWFYETGNVYSVSAGASGAICGIAGGLLYIYIRNRKANKQFTWLRGAIYAALLLSTGLGVGEEGINVSAHISGFVLGVIITAILYEMKLYRIKKEKQEKA